MTPELFFFKQVYRISKWNSGRKNVFLVVKLPNIYMKYVVKTSLPQSNENLEEK